MRIVLDLILAVIFLFIVLGWPAYENAIGLLSTESGQQKAQALVVLGGGTPERQLRAIELYRSRVAPLIITTGDGEPETAQWIYQMNGVPKNSVLVEPKSKNTWQNASYTIPMLRERGITNVVLVTSWFHSRRALRTFQILAPDIQFQSKPTYWGARRDLWVPCGLKRYIIAEYVKMPWYWVRGVFGKKFLGHAIQG